MVSETARHYLVHFPVDAARVIESAKPEDARAFLASLPVSEQTLAFSNLLPDTAARHMVELPVEDAADLVEALRAGAAARILSEIPQSRRRPILDAVSSERRATIRHLLRYPEDSVGALMLSQTLACRNDANVRRAKQLVRRFAHTELPLMVVVDDAMRPVGLVPVSRLLSAREREPVTDVMRASPRPLRALADVRTVLDSPAWATDDFLPVTDADGRYVGILPKARLHEHALAAPAVENEGSDLSTTVLALADMVWTPAAELLARASTDRPENANE